ncbi:hypothetical protein X566_03525 [Afipia sp. P52-10]|nr:hypothetical protein [Afipia sp. P52-10]ETR76795.1 hypothetical protein X566_03525 [Afipia sp. P52-10]
MDRWTSGVRSRALLVAGVFVLAALSTPVAAIDLRPEVAKLYESVSVYPPNGNSMTVCYGFVCRRRELFDFTAADKKTLAAILAAGKAGPAAERAAIQKAVVWFDKRLGPIIGTTKRIARADFRYNADKSNYDCWDTTRNITGLLVLLQDWGYLRHHTVSDPRYRGNVLVLQTPHNTPVIKEKAAGSEWAVDMWTVGYAQPPQVITIAQWMTEQ